MFTYLIRRADGSTFRAEVPFLRPSQRPEPTPAWTALAFRRCSHCPLDPAVHPRCPPAADLADVVAAFAGAQSTEPVEVEVQAAERTYLRRTDLQGALRSLLGLVMATGGCPYLSRLRGMAHFHLPFSTRVETTWRVASAYLLEQYLVQQDGGRPDFALEGLRALYEDLQLLNRHFADRLRGAVQMDAGPNAVASLFTLASLVSFSLDDDLEDLRHVFTGAGSGPASD